MTEEQKADRLDFSISTLQMKIEVLISLAERAESDLQILVENVSLSFREQRDQAALVVFQAQEVLDQVKIVEANWCTMELSP